VASASGLSSRDRSVGEVARGEIVESWVDGTSFGVMRLVGAPPPEWDVGGRLGIRVARLMARGTAEGRPVVLVGLVRWPARR
jgi:hypothetical protein